MVEQPHFDDEITVLTAQPVVPLEQLEAKVKHRRRWFLGGAFVVAMLLGAAAALVSAYLKIRNAPDPEIQPSSVSSVVPVETVDVVPPERPSATSRNPDKKDRRAPERVPANRPQLSEEEELRRIRDAVLVDQWEERRQRRVERPERPKAQHRDRDLTNLDEIFEGPRRP